MRTTLALLWCPWSYGLLRLASGVADLSPTGFASFLRGLIILANTRAVSAGGDMCVSCTPKAFLRPSTAYGRPCSRARKPVITTASGLCILPSRGTSSEPRRVKKLVAVGPGHSATTRTPSFRYSAQSARLNESTNADLSSMECNARTSQGYNESRHYSYRIITSYANPDSLPVVKRLTRSSKVPDVNRSVSGCHAQIQQGPSTA